MKQPRYYVRITAGYFMAGMHGFRTKRAAQEFMYRWRAANHVDNAIGIIRA